MPGTERLFQFPAKPAPVGADIIYVGDSAATYNEVKSTIAQILANVTAKTGSGLAATGSTSGVALGFAAPVSVGNVTAVTMASGNSYIVDSSSQVTFTIPASPAEGDYYEIIGAFPLGWLLAVDGSGLQSIFFNGAATNFGSTGVVITPTSQFSAIRIECISSDAGVEFDFSITQSNSPLLLLTEIATTQLVHPAMDANFNVTANNLLNGYATTVTAAATTTLAVSSQYQQYFTGSTTQTVKMPVVTTLVLGQSWLLVNNSSGVVTVQSSGSNTIATMAANTTLVVTCIKVTADTTAAAWNFEANLQSALTLPVPIAQGGTAKTSVTTAPAATSWAGWDANSNLSANNHLEGYATTATAAATTTLLVGSAYQQYFTGSTTQTVLLPVTSTLVLGQSFYIVNNSSGVVTVQSSGANAIQAMAANSSLLVTCILTSGTTAASWNAEYTLQTPLAFTAATKAQQQAATSNIVTVTPAVQQYHPSATQAWIQATISGGVATSVASYNISSITNNATGVYSPNFSVAFAGTVYSVVGSPQTVNAATFYLCMTRNNGTGSMLIYTATGTPTVPVMADPPGFCMVANGVQ